jgi:SagB-type dehydrogenase family enzyme
MLPDSNSGIDVSPEDGEISLSELFHENSKQRRYDLAFYRRIAAVNSTPGIHDVISQAFKTYPGVNVVPLPDVQPTDGPSFEHVVVERRSVREFSGEALEQSEIAKLLYFGNGITGTLETSAHHTVQRVRAAPSAGALYPVELYALISAGADIGPGIYHYAVPDHALECLTLGDFTHALGKSTSYEAVFSKASITIILTIMFGRTRFKYGERGYRFALLEAGHIAQNILLTATALALGAVAIGGFIDDEINKMLDIDGVDEASIYLIPIGRPVSRLEEDLMRTQSVLDSALQMLWADEFSLDDAGRDDSDAC